MKLTIYSYLFYGTVIALGLYVIITSRNGTTNDFILLPLLILAIVFFAIHTYLKKKRSKN